MCWRYLLILFGKHHDERPGRAGDSAQLLQPHRDELGTDGKKADDLSEARHSRSLQQGAAMTIIEKCPVCGLQAGSKKYPKAFEPVMASKSVYLRNPHSIGIEIKCPVCCHSAQVIANDILPLPISDSLVMMDALAAIAKVAFININGEKVVRIISNVDETKGAES